MKKLLTIPLLLLLVCGSARATGLDSLLKHRYHAIGAGIGFFGDGIQTGGNLQLYYINKGYGRFSMNPGIRYGSFGTSASDALTSSHESFKGLVGILNFQLRSRDKLLHLDAAYQFSPCKGMVYDEIFENSVRKKTNLGNKSANFSSFTLGAGISIWKIEFYAESGVIRMRELPDNQIEFYKAFRMGLIFVFNRSRGQEPK